MFKLLLSNTKDIASILTLVRLMTTIKNGSYPSSDNISEINLLVKGFVVANPTSKDYIASEVVYCITRLIVDSDNDKINSKHIIARLCDEIISLEEYDENLISQYIDHSKAIIQMQSTVFNPKRILFGIKSVPVSFLSLVIARLSLNYHVSLGLVDLDLEDNEFLVGLLSNLSSATISSMLSFLDMCNGGI